MNVIPYEVEDKTSSKDGYTAILIEPEGRRPIQILPQVKSSPFQGILRIEKIEWA